MSKITRRIGKIKYIATRNHHQCPSRTGALLREALEFVSLNKVDIAGALAAHTDCLRSLACLAGDLYL